MRATPVLVIETVTLMAVADRCRAAVVAFLHGSRGGWMESDVAEWLQVHYAPAVDVVAGEMPDLDLFELERTVYSARERIFNLLLELANGNNDCVDWAEVKRLVAPVRDANGVIGYLPRQNANHSSLYACVASLLLADYTSRPQEYRDQLCVCAECGSVSFDGEAHAGLDCAADAFDGVIEEREHRALSQSGVVLRPGVASTRRSGAR